MPIHVAILKKPYLDLILAGAKTTESRLTKTAVPPYRRIQSSERLFLKQSGGPFLATALAGKIDSFDNLTRQHVERLRLAYQPTVGGDDDYWRSKSDSRFATFIALTSVEPLAVGPAYPKINMKAWHVLDDRLSPLCEISLSAGAIRNRYAPFPTSRPVLSQREAPDPFNLHARGGSPAHLRLLLPDGRTIDTEIIRGRMIRWRGWGHYYDRHRMAPGDVIRFVAVAPRTFRISFHRPTR